MAETPNPVEGRDWSADMFGCAARCALCACAAGTLGLGEQMRVPSGLPFDAKNPSKRPAAPAQRYALGRRGGRGRSQKREGPSKLTGCVRAGAREGQTHQQPPIFAVSKWYVLWRYACCAS